MAWTPKTADEARVAVADALAQGRTLELVGTGTRRGFGRPVAADEVLDLSALNRVVTYQPEELIGRLVVAVVNFPKKQIGPLMSECLVTGFHNADGHVALCVPDQEIPLGTRLL